ncbi:hypothetical protein TrVGV298_009158 [Trichoderma virens]|nr:hypothetical protein TrVGV298_009158 [Trichoderma virens]
MLGGLEWGLRLEGGLWQDLDVKGLLVLDEEAREVEGCDMGLERPLVDDSLPLPLEQVVAASLQPRAPPLNQANRLPGVVAVAVAAVAAWRDPEMQIPPKSSPPEEQLEKQQLEREEPGEEPEEERSLPPEARETAQAAAAT